VDGGPAIDAIHCGRAEINAQLLILQGDGDAAAGAAKADDTARTTSGIKTVPGWPLGRSIKRPNPAMMNTVILPPLAHDKATDISQRDTDPAEIGVIRGNHQAFILPRRPPQLRFAPYWDGQQSEHMPEVWGAETSSGGLG
jgi:hypothetical protein